MNANSSIRLGDIIAIKHGYAFPGDEFGFDPSYPTLVTPGNFVIGGGFKHAKPKTFTGPYPEEYNLLPGDLIVTMTDLSKEGDTLGMPALVPATGHFLHNQRIGRVTIIDGAAVDKNFLSYFLRSSQYHSYIIGSSSGSTVRHTSPSRICDFEVILPGVSDQIAIAEVLGALDDKIAANTKLAATFEALGSVKLQALGINAGPDSNSVTLDTLFDVNPRRTPSSDIVPLIDMQALPTSSPLIESWSQGPKKGGTRFMNGDTLLARITPCLENRKTGFVDFLEDGHVGIGSTEFIVIRSKEGLPLGLSYFMATSNRFRDFAIQNMVGTSGRQRVAATDIARFEFNAISTSDLVEFGTWADKNLSLLGSLRNENRILSATRDALLPQLMSGKLRVKDAESLIAAAV